MNVCGGALISPEDLGGPRARSDGLCRLFCRVQKRAALERAARFRVCFGLLVIALGLLAPGCRFKPQEAIPSPLAQETVVVRAVADGDTFATSDGRTVRLLGLDTPEVYREGLGTEYYSAEASQALRDLIEGRSVLLWRDVQDCDQYGRLLRYVFVGEGTFVNWYIVRHGFAQALSIPPNRRFHELLLDAQIQAKREGLGMWPGPVGQYTKGAMTQ